MAAKLVNCSKLGRELPALDPDTPEGNRALKLAFLIGGAEMQQRIRENVSAEAWEMWTKYMLMVMNEFHVDPQSDESNKVLRPHMEAFFFGDSQQMPGYTPQS